MLLYHNGRIYTELREPMALTWSFSHYFYIWILYLKVGIKILNGRQPIFTQILALPLKWFMTKQRGRMILKELLLDHLDAHTERANEYRFLFSTILREVNKKPLEGNMVRHHRLCRGSNLLNQSRVERCYQLWARNGWEWVICHRVW